MSDFDYIVVGAGSAGCVVAARLSEDPGCRVLLLEAGPEPNHFWLTAPAGVGMMFLNKRFNWRFTTEPVSTLGGRTIYWPRGKTLGGSSAINGMVYMRGHPLDFDHWASLGNEGWSWHDVLPYFNKSEANVRGSSDYHGGSGEMCVSDPVIHHPSTDDFIDSAITCGIKPIPDLNAPPNEGVSYQQFTIRNGRRESSYTAFIKPIRGRKNLEVRSKAHVQRIVIEKDRAVGVEIVQDGKRGTIRCSREVVLSAGALGSPQILNLSGIGDGSHLGAIGVKTITHLPGVGRNLQDHWNAPFLLRVTAESSYNKRLLGWRKYREGLQYLLTHRGFLAMGSSAVSAYVRSSPDQPQPDLQLAIRPMTFDFGDDGTVVIDPLPGVSAASVLVGPKSRGHLLTRSSDPKDSPAIHPNYLSDPDDVRRALIGMRMMRSILATKPLSRRIVTELSPGPNVNSDDELIDHLKRKGGTSWHPVGTCRMGPKTDPMAVVDARLRVHGIEGLRVVDASIMPRITSGNTHAPTVMIGEKGADMIHEDERDVWRRPSAAPLSVGDLAAPG